jgi:hypothetical protein
MDGLTWFYQLLYLLAQAELFATVIKGFPVWDTAGFIGSTLWLVWLIIIGIKFMKIELSNANTVS